MLELLLALLVLAAVAWQWRRWLRAAHDAGVREGYALAERNALARQEQRKGATDGHDR